MRASVGAAAGERWDGGSDGHGGALRHEALFYRGDDEFLDGTTPLIESAISAGEPVMAIVDGRKIELLRAHLGEDAEAVQFADMRRAGRNPARLVSVWRDFVDAHRDAPRLHGIGEPAWPGRDEAELAECGHHEALLNRAFQDAPEFRLLCPYDGAGLDPAVLEHALRNHPWITDATGTRKSDAYLDAERMPDPLADPLAPPPADAERLAFATGEDLPPLRRFAEERAAAAGLDAMRVSDVVFAINELATNSLRHGSGAGELLSWRRPGTVVFEVQDHGRILDPLIGRSRPAIDQPQGRGLWLVNELCDLVQVRSDEHGNRIRLWVMGER